MQLYKMKISNAPISGKLERGTLNIHVKFQTIDFLKQFVKLSQSS